MSLTTRQQRYVRRSPDVKGFVQVTARPTDRDLVDAFTKAVADLSQEEAAERAPGISHDDVSRWRRGDWKWVSARKRRALQAFLRSYAAPTDQDGTKAQALLIAAERMEHIARDLRVEAELLATALPSDGDVHAQLLEWAEHAKRVNAEWKAQKEAEEQKRQTK